MSEQIHKLIVGLGNVGEEYQQTRHNLGFMVLDELGRHQKISFSNEPGLEAAIANFEDVALLKPQTMMNRSGRAVRLALERSQLTVEDLLLIYDELELPFGTIRTRSDGVSAGHNGVQSVIDTLGSQDFSRIRIGTGTEKSGGADFVLSSFSKKESPYLPEIIEEAKSLALGFAHGEFESTTFRLSFDR